MKFIFNEKSSRYFLEFGRKKKVDSILIEINDELIAPNEEVDIKNGQYDVNVRVIYTDQTFETIKNQRLVTNGKDILVKLDMMSFFHRLVNAIVNIRFGYILFAALIASLFAPELGIILATGSAMVVFYSGNDFVYKRLGFDKTFRAKFRKKII